MIRQRIGSGYPYEDTFGYSRAFRAGNQVFVSGTTARGDHLTGDVYQQARAVLVTIGAALANAGATLDDVVRTVVYVVDLADAAAVARAHSECLGAVRPASTLVQVAGLMPAGAQVEIEVTAVISG